VPLIGYAPATQRQAADELRTLPPGSVIGRMIVDYGQLRRAVCAAEGWQQRACRQIAGRPERD
jgi:hypothetical protein